MESFKNFVNQFLYGQTGFPGSGRRLDETVRTPEVDAEMSAVRAAALARHIDVKPTPEFTAAKAHALRDMASGKQESSSQAKTLGSRDLGPEQRPSDSESDRKTTKMQLAVNDVYFRCPLVSDECLSRNDWNMRIKEYLENLTTEEPWFSRALMIWSCNTSKPMIMSCIETIGKYFDNIIRHPNEKKYQRIKLNNRVFKEKVLPVIGGLDFLKTAGFKEEKLTNEDGSEDDYLVFQNEEAGDLEFLAVLVEAMNALEPIKLYLDRDLKVMLPSQAAGRMELPENFFHKSCGEILKQQANNSKVAEQQTMLCTRASREKKEMREQRRKYKFALIRIRFPDGVLLQGTFWANETFEAIHKFVKENLAHDIPFSIKTPTGETLNLAANSTQTLLDLKLVPATVLTFAWERSALNEVRNSETCSEYLKPETRSLLTEV